METKKFKLNDFRVEYIDLDLISLVDCEDVFTDLEQIKKNLGRIRTLLLFDDPLELFLALKYQRGIDVYKANKQDIKELRTLYPDIKIMGLSFRI